MKKILLLLPLLGSLGLATAASAADLAPPPPPAPVPGPAPFSGSKFPPVVLQLGPTTTYSTINCANFTKLPEGAWKALDGQPFSLGFTQGIIPPVRPILVGGFIYNNIDLYTQLETQCAATLVRARY